MAAPTTNIGLFLIYGIVLLPVYVMFAGWLVGSPREYRPVAIAFGYLIGFIALVVASLAALDIVITMLS